MTVSSPRLALTIPNADGSDDADLAALLRSLGLDVENKAPGVTALTTAQRTALTGDALFAGRTVYDTDDGGLWRTNGTTWRKLAILDADGHLPMGSKKVTGLGDGTASTDAVTKGQLDAAMPLGAIIAYGGTSAPTGWHLCNGSAHESASLQSLIGSANTPDLRNKFIVAAGSTYSRGDQGGEATHTLTAAESGLPAHIHQLGLGIGGAQEYTGGGAGYSWHDSTEVGVQKYSLQNGAANASSAHNNLPPYYALVYIIKKA